MEIDDKKKDERTPDAESFFEDIPINGEVKTESDGEAAPAVPKKKGRKTKITVLVILAIFLLLAGGGIFLINSLLNRINHLDPSTVSQLSPSEIAALESEYWASVNSEEGETKPDKPDPGKVVRAPFQADAYRATLSADDEQILFDHPVSYSWMKAASLNDEDLINIMLVGQDTRFSDTRERSDTMILVSINPKTHKVSMTSFLRDLYVPIGESYGMGRLNTAYKIGGFPFMYQVFEENFGVHIDGGICVNFGQFMTLVDTLGGLDVTLNETEAKWLRYTIEQSIPDMRYWGQIIEAQMPAIREGTSVQDAIAALKAANLTFAYSDMNGGVAPDDIATAKVKSLWSDASCSTAAKAGRYYNLQQTIYITYSENRVPFPKLAEELSVSSTVTLLKDLGFTTGFADLMGGTAPEDGKAALITKVSLDAAGEDIPVPGKKYERGTKIYITYIENKVSVPKLDKDISVKDAETQLKAAGLKISWAESCGGKAPTDKALAKLTGIYLDQKETKVVQAGDKLDVNTVVYLTYQDNKITMPKLAAGISVKEAEDLLKAAGFRTAYSTANKSKAPANKEKAALTKVTTDAAGTKPAREGNRFDPDTILYLTYTEQEETTTEHEHSITKWTSNRNGMHSGVCSGCGKRVTESCTYNSEGVCTKCGYEHPHQFGKWTSNNNGTHTHICSGCGKSETENCSYKNGVCEFCGYRDPSATTPEDTTEEETTEYSTVEPPTIDSSTDSGIDDPNPPADAAAASNESLTAVPEEHLTYAAESAASSDEKNIVVKAATSPARSLYNPILLTSASKTAPEAYEPEYLRGIAPGRVHLNGMQTLAYCRMRKLDSDFKRTERQRMVLNTLFAKVRSSDAGTLKRLLDALLPQVATDLSNGEIMSLAAQILPYFSSIQINSYSVPVDGSWRNVTIDGMAVVQADQEANMEAIRSWLPF